MASEPEWKHRRFHFVGIGGSGIRAVAVVCARLGAVVTGSDMQASPSIDQLRASGITVSVGHTPANVADGVEVVYSSAVNADNVERRRAAELGLRQVKRGDLLAELTTLKRCIAVGGSHGKTTTTAMIAHAMRGAGAPASHILGADLRDGTPSSSWQEGAWLVVETDEADRTFLAIRPDVAVVTNVEREHLSEYSTLGALQQAFAAFLAGATAVVVPDSPDMRALTGGRAAATFAPPDASLGPYGSRFHWREYPVALPVPGAHNAGNAVAALEACALAGVDPEAAAMALADFPGVRHRLEPLGATGSRARVYEDCANHANTVRASLAALRTVEPGRIVAVYEPLLYGRTRAMADDVGAALAAADAIVVLEIYSGSEGYVDHPDVSGQVVALATKAHGGDRPVVWAPSTERARHYLMAELRPGDACIVMGVGPEAAGLARDLVGQA